jgi:FdhE protein
VIDTTARHVTGAMRELEALAQKRAVLQDACRVLSALVETIFKQPTTERPLVLSTEHAHTKLASGVPLLRDLQLEFDEAAFVGRWQAVCSVLQRPDAQALAGAVCDGVLRPIPLLHEILAAKEEAVENHTGPPGLNASLTATVLRMTALPALIRLTQPCSDLRQGIAWDNGYCPNCGSWPLLGEARGLEQDRVLRCGLCAAAWPVDRLHCPFCDNRDHRSLGYVHLEGEEDRYRAGSCDLCHGYVKWASTMFPLSVPHLLVADLATLHLDMAAAERGFFVP